MVEPRGGFGAKLLAAVEGQLQIHECKGPAITRVARADLATGGQGADQDAPPVAFDAKLRQRQQAGAFDLAPVVGGEDTEQLGQMTALLGVVPIAIGQRRGPPSRHEMVPGPDFRSPYRPDEERIATYRAGYGRNRHGMPVMLPSSVTGGSHLANPG